MKDLTITQEYLICTVNDKGNIPQLNSEPVTCLVASGLLEMKMEECILIDSKMVSVCAELPERLQCLKPLYDVVNQGKPIKLRKVLEAYAVSFSDKQLRELMISIFEPLKDSGMVTLVKSGILGNKENYAPTKNTVDGIIKKIRAELLGEEEVTDDVAVLTALLDKSGQLKNYLSKYERTELKDKLRDIKNSETGKSIRLMIDYVEMLYTIIGIMGII